MTLVARSKPPRYHKKTTGQHHRQTKAYHKAYWPYLPIIAVLLAGLLVNQIWPVHSGAVLGYATDMSVQNLLDDTNAQRGDNNEGGLSLNALLDQAAQTKANDMVARDYWSHDTPDGQTPWSFILNASYTYVTAGENLAYGFDTASNTLTGWMNSPGHRANILNTTYQEVGFGIANSANYQNSGPETVVVAMYAEPTGVPVATTAPTAPATNQQTTTTNGQTSNSGAGGSAGQTPSSSPAPVATSTPTDTSKLQQTTPATTKTLIEEKTQPIKRVQMMTAGNASWSALAVTVIILASLAAFLLRHGIAWHKVIRKGERFVLKHPLLDTVFAALIVIGLLLSQASGFIR